MFRQVIYKKFTFWCLENLNKIKCLKCSFKFIIFVMIWGWEIVQSPGKLYIVYTTVISRMFQEILEHFMIPSLENLCDDNFIF